MMLHECTKSVVKALQASNFCLLDKAVHTTADTMGWILLAVFGSRMLRKCANCRDVQRN